MTNVLNAMIANQSFSMGQKKSSFTFDTTGKIKPLEDKAVLLPSKIFGSPVEGIKDLKTDILSIGKAAKGEANDHELGRINSLAMKLGSAGIAAFLFIKNPLKLSKTMEIAGFGAFFASMSLWPKLAIQAPLKARTGVDFQQEYIDSQGRKKMLYQDPQYVLTDLLPRKELDNIGKKMGVNENLPDRDGFIKQRAQKTALQANTLWMMTAGVATPLGSALMCSAGEKILKPAIEKIDLYNTRKKYLAINPEHDFTTQERNPRLYEFTNFLDENKDKKLDKKMLNKIEEQFKYLLKDSSFAELEEPIHEELKKLSSSNVSMEILENTFGKDAMAALNKEERQLVLEELEDNSISKKNKIANISSILSDNKAFQEKGFRADEIEAKIKKASQNLTVGDVETKVGKLYQILSKFNDSSSVIESYVDVRIGEREGSSIANHWEKVTNKVVDMLNLDNLVQTKELKQLAQGDEELLDKKLTEFVRNENFNKNAAELIEMVSDYETDTKQGLLKDVKAASLYEILDRENNVNKLHDVCETTRRTLTSNGFEYLAEKMTGKTPQLDESLLEYINKTEAEKKLDPDAAAKEAKIAEYKRTTVAHPGTIERKLADKAQERVLGAKSSLYRMIMTLDIYKQIEDGTMKNKITQLLENEGRTADEETIKKLEQACKDIMLKAKTTDHIERLTSRGFELSKEDFKVVMSAVFDGNDNNSFAQFDKDGKLTGGILKEAGMTDEAAKEIMDNYKNHLEDVKTNVANWNHPIRKDFAQRVINSGAPQSSDGTRRNGIIGRSIHDMLIDTANKKYNSKKWNVLFGGIMLGLTAITLGAGLMLGGKSKMEQQAEEGIKKNA